jgi:sugar lactone lactonase YvrE
MIQGRSCAAALSLILGLWHAGLSHAQTGAAPEVWASFPSPTFIENLDVAPDGTALVTNYTGKGLELVSAGQPVRRFATLEAHPVSVLRLNGGLLVAVHGKSFVDRPAFIGSGRLLRLDSSGKPVSDVAVPEAGMLNGMVPAPDGAVLIADSIKGQIMRFDPAAGTVATIFSDPRLVAQTAPYFLPGANGLKIRDGQLYISSSAQKTLFRIAISADGKISGEMSVFARFPGADDFVLLPEGGIVMTTHGDRIIRQAADGTQSVVTTDPRVLGNTSVGLVGTGPGRKLLVLGTGGFSEGGKGDAVVLAVPLPSP